MTPAARARLRTEAARALVAAKREGHGITAGHFASFKPEVVLALLDALDAAEARADRAEAIVASIATALGGVVTAIDGLDRAAHESGAGSTTYPTCGAAPGERCTNHPTD